MTRILTGLAAIRHDVQASGLLSLDPEGRAIYDGTMTRLREGLEVLERKATIAGRALDELAARLEGEA